MRPHVYINSDVPEGMTLSEWRSSRVTAPERARVIVLTLGWFATFGAFVASVKR